MWEGLDCARLCDSCVKERQHSTALVFSFHCSCFTSLEVDLNSARPEGGGRGPVLSVVGVLWNWDSEARRKCFVNTDHLSYSYVILLSDLVSTWFVSECTLLSDYDDELMSHFISQLCPVTRAPQNSSSVADTASVKLELDVVFYDAFVIYSFISHVLARPGLTGQAVQILLFILHLCWAGWLYSLLFDIAYRFQIILPVQSRINTPNKHSLNHSTNCDHSWATRPSECWPRSTGSLCPWRLKSIKVKVLYQAEAQSDFDNF